VELTTCRPSSIALDAQGQVTRQACVRRSPHDTIRAEDSRRPSTACLFEAGPPFFVGPAL
jgi:hypothetical protein